MAEPGRPFPLPVYIEFAPGQFTEHEEIFLSRMLLSDLSGSDGTVVIWTVSRDDQESLQRLGLPGSLEVFFDKAEDRYQYRSVYRRMADREVLLQRSNSDGQQSVYRNPARLFSPVSEGVRELVAELLASGDFEDSSQHYRALLRVKAPEGARISISGVTEEIRPGEIALPAPSVYEIRVSSPRHFPESFVVSLPLSGAEVELVPQRARASFFDLYLADGNVPGFRWGYRLGKQRQWFLAAGGYSYLVTIIPLNEDENPDFAFFYSTPLSVIDLQAGMRFGEAEDRYRLYLSGGGFARIVHSSRYRGPDPIGPGGIIGTLGGEVRSGTRLSLFAEWVPHLFFTENIDSLKQFYTRAAWELPAPASARALVVADHFRVGMRIQL